MRNVQIFYYDSWENIKSIKSLPKTRWTLNLHQLKGMLLKRNSVVCSMTDAIAIIWWKMAWENKLHDVGGHYTFMNVASCGLFCLTTLLRKLFLWTHRGVSRVRLRRKVRHHAGTSTRNYGRTAWAPAQLTNRAPVRFSTFLWKLRGPYAVFCLNYRCPM